MYVLVFLTPMPNGDDEASVKIVAPNGVGEEVTGILGGRGGVLN